MKKLIAGIISAFLMTAGLVAFSGAQVHAAPGDPYPGSTPTDVETAPLKPSPRGAQRVRIDIQPEEGAGVPRGWVYITYVRRDGKSTYNFKRWYSGPPRDFKLPRVKRRGNYVVTVTFVPNNNSIYQASSSTFAVWVPGKRR